MKNGTAKTGTFIAIANMKGGVGKTTTVVSLAEALAADDLATSVLVVDLDPQASASLCLAGDDLLADLIEGGRTLQDFLELRLFEHDQKRSLLEFVRSHLSLTTHRGQQLNISLLPCGPKLRLFEREIIYAYTKKGHSMNGIEGVLWTMFKAYFRPLRETYDYIIFDCPPGISPFTEVAIRSSDLVIIPTIPDEISNFGLNAFCESLWRSEVGSTLPRPPKPFVLPTRVQQNVKQHVQMLSRFEVEAAASDSAYRLIRTRIPQAAALASALVLDGHPTFTQKYGPAIVPVLDALTQEIKEMCHAGRD
ncbi:AAA family ATPase [Lichenihabitans sp. PAMC28606]|uniref:ParA family protein n=1 Tax=Lichenihabitans sp. PAMC28606 TaxID=2880932 RepID=UPI001D0B7A17|nr:AAA family ATPase [Lichenihabitans sp. PAMC28606]UDL93251.1 AAA family ATPase [Lichenihabitans sp. PAMC28606]